MTESCEERINDELKRAMKHVRGALMRFSHWCNRCGYEWYSDDESPGCPDCDSGKVYTEEASIDALEFTHQHDVYKLLLSTGGPADGFYIYVDPEDREIVRVEYFFQDWFDGATRELRDAEFDAVEQVIRRHFYIERS